MTNVSPVDTYFRLRAKVCDVYSIENVRDRVASHLKLTHEFTQCVERLFQMDHADPQVCHAIGDAYAAGRGVPIDKEKAFFWLRRAAEADIPNAMVTFNICVSRSKNAQAVAEGIRWLRRGAELGHPSAMVMLGFAYREGEGVETDYKQAAAWFIKAVRAGDTHSAMYVESMSQCT